MSENIAGLPSSNYATENIYRVTHIDRDSGGKSGEGFERHAKEEKDESADTAEQSSVIRDLEPAVIRDDMILSDSAKQMLESSVGTAPVTVQPKESLPEQPKDIPLIEEGTVGSRIDITA
ncbi:MAG: hypothetical protein A2283_05430 [Lentisphaerae bacterium RIFOXYA12_FULL_48_11]|nr:MAG: hypothetical protein A2283_05430 [Lentisphaerae bacterium RIFOXYA12_FULL_48_11]